MGGREGEEVSGFPRGWQANGAESCRLTETQRGTNNRPPRVCVWCCEDACGCGRVGAAGGAGVLALRQSTEDEWDVLLDCGAGKDASSDERARSHA